MLSVGSPVRSAQARISCEPPIQVTVCSTPALRRASIETRESLPPPMATRAWRRRPSCSPFPSGISPSPSRGGPGWGWVSVGLGGNPSPPNPPLEGEGRSEEHTSELQSLMRISYAVFCLKKNNNYQTDHRSQSSHINNLK